MTLKEDSIQKNFPELRRVSIRTDEVFVRLELQSPKNIIVNPAQGPGEGGFPTGWGWILKVGEACTMYDEEDVGKKIRLKDNVDLQPQVDISSTSEPKMVRNPNAKLFTFKKIHDNDKDLKHFIKYPTALIYEHEIAGVDEGV